MGQEPRTSPHPFYLEPKPTYLLIAQHLDTFTRTFRVKLAMYLLIIYSERALMWGMTPVVALVSCLLLSSKIMGTASFSFMLSADK